MSGLINVLAVVCALFLVCREMGQVSGASCQVSYSSSCATQQSNIQSTSQQVLQDARNMISQAVSGGSFDSKAAINTMCGNVAILEACANNYISGCKTPPGSADTVRDSVAKSRKQCTDAGYVFSGASAVGVSLHYGFLALAAFLAIRNLV